MRMDGCDFMSTPVSVGSKRSRVKDYDLDGESVHDRKRRKTPELLSVRLSNCNNESLERPPLCSEGNANDDDTRMDVFRSPQAVQGPSQNLSQGHVTPRVNPFERNLLSRLRYQMCSPGMFVSSETPPTSGWGIDQLSKLFPKNIEASPSTHQNDLELTPESEAKAQAEIKQFFSEPSHIAPSPQISQPTASQFRQVGSRMSTGSIQPLVDQFAGLSQSPILGGSNSNSQGSGLGSQSTMVSDSWTLTDLSLPPVLPPELEEALKPYLSSGVACVSETSCPVPGKSRAIINGNNGLSQASVGNTSLRRRLQFTFDETETFNNASNEAEDSDDESYISDISDGEGQGGRGSPILSPSRVTLVSPGTSRVMMTSPSSSSLMEMSSGFHSRVDRSEFLYSSYMGSPGLTPIRNNVPS